MITTVGMQRFLHLLPILAIGMLLPIGSHAQDEEDHIYYLARVDANNDGIIEAEETMRLYAGPVDSISEAVSADDVSVGQFSVNERGDIVLYAGTIGENQAARIADLTSGAQVAVAVGEFAFVAPGPIGDNAWIVGYGEDQIPVIRGLDSTTGATINERKLRRPDTLVAFNDSGNMVMAYHAELGALSVYALPSLEPMDFEIGGYANSAPVWSPAEAAFVIGAGRVEDPADIGVLIVDLERRETTWLDVPDVAGSVVPSLQWSPGGRYISYIPQMNVPNAAEGPGLLHLLDTAFDTVATVPFEGQSVRVVEWLGDAKALLLAQPIADDEAEFEQYFLVDPATGTAVPVDALDSLDVVTMRANPDTSQVAVAGQSYLNGRFGLYLFALDGESAEPEPLLSSVDPALVRSSQLLWTTDGDQLIYTASSGDPVLTTLEDITAVFMYDLPSQSTLRLSPESVFVDPLSVQVR